MPFEPQNFTAGVIVGVVFAMAIILVLALASNSGAGWQGRHKKAAGIEFAGVWSDIGFDIGKNDVALAHVKVVDGHILTVWSSVGYHLRAGTEGGRDDRVWVRIGNDEEDKLRQGE